MKPSFCQVNNLAAKNMIRLELGNGQQEMENGLRKRLKRRGVLIAATSRKEYHGSTRCVN
jgi:hypothetical protein